MLHVAFLVTKVAKLGRFLGLSFDGVEQILCSLTSAAPYDAIHVGKQMAEGTDVAAPKRCSCLLLDTQEDVGGGHPLPLFVALGNGEEIVEVDLLWRAHLELAVRLHHKARLLLVHPVGLPAVEQCNGLGIELLVVDAIRHVDGSRQLDADEAAVARGICQQVADIGCGDERGQAGKLLDMFAVGTFHLHARQLDDVLQESLLHLGTDLVELVEVDEQELAHGLQHGLLLRQHQVVVVSPLQLFWYQRLAESGLVVSLTRDE